MPHTTGCWCLCLGALLSCLIQELFLGQWESKQGQFDPRGSQGSSPSTSECRRHLGEQQSLGETHPEQPLRWSWRTSAGSTSHIDLELETCSPASTPYKIRKYFLEKYFFFLKKKDGSKFLFLHFLALNELGGKQPTVITPENDQGKETRVCSFPKKLPSPLISGKQIAWTFNPLGRDIC